MGTSNTYAGPAGGNPLIPSWLDASPIDGSPEPVPNPDESDGNKTPDNSPQDNQPSTQPVKPALPPANFQTARGSLSRYINSGGNNRQALGRAISNYVAKSSGGSSVATTRMGSSRAAAGRLLGFLADAQTRGVDQALRNLDLGSLIGKSATDIFFGLADYICPSDGAIDAGIARDAYAETVAEILEAGVTSLDALSIEQVGIAFEAFMANSIFTRLCNDIGAGVVQLPKDPREAVSIQGQIKEFLRGSVRDALAQTLIDMKTVSQGDTRKMADSLYARAFSILAVYNEK